MASNTSDFFTFSKTAGTAKNLQKPTDGGDNNLWGGFINVDLDTIVGAVNATSDLIADANQNELVDFTATGSAVNHVGIKNAATGNGPTIEATGDDTNIDLNVSGKGTGALTSTGAKLTSPKVITAVNDTNGNELVKVTATGSAVNEITVANAATGNGPTLSATGDDTNIDLNIAGKGSGTAKFTSNIIIPDAGNIGSVSDPDALAISSAGIVSMASGNGYRFIGIQSFTSSGTYTKSSSVVNAVLVYVTGGGGGGGGGGINTQDAGGGGGAGGTTIKWITSGLGSTETVTVGGGGASRAGNVTTDGGDGGNSVFGTSGTSVYVVANGGFGGKDGNSYGVGGAGGSASTTGDINLSGGEGYNGGDDVGSVMLPAGGGGPSFWGGAGRGATVVGDGGTGANGSGGGGGKNNNTKSSGAGGAGLVVVYEYIQ